MERFLLLHRNIKIRLLECFVTCLLGNMLWPFMAVYFVSKFGELIAGFLLAFNVLVAIVAGLIGGKLADRFGRRKIMLLAFAFAIPSSLMMAIANSPWYDSAILTFAAFSFHGAIFGLAGPASEAMLLDAIDNDEDRKYVYGLEYWIFNLSFLIGAFVGGLLFENHRFFIMIGIVFGDIFALSIMWYIKDIYKPKKENVQVNYLKIFKDKTFVAFALGISLLFSLERQVQNYLAVQLSKEPHGLMTYSWIMSENTFLVVLLGFFMTTMLQKGKTEVIFWCSAVIYTSAFVLLSQGRDLSFLFMMMGMATLAEIALVSSSQTLQANLIPENNRGSYLAVRSAIGRGTAIMGSLSITVSYYLPSWGMALFFASIGLFSFVLCQVIRR